jgi:tyrosyl-tRNA synthetase
MFRKVMQVSDALMFRYYELLTDRSMAEIDTMRQKIAAGELHPMEVKIALAKAIVGDFHSAQEAERAAEVFNAVVRRKEVPDDIPEVLLPEGVRAPAGIRVDKLLAKIGLAESVSAGARLVKAGAVEINGEKVRDLVLPDPPAELLIQVGKNWRRVRL